MDPFALIAVERRRLADELDGLGDDEWASPSLCDGWNTHVVGAHLNVPWSLRPLDFPKAMLAARGRFAVANDRLAVDLAERLSPTECVASLRSHAEHRFTPPGHGPTAPLTDTIIHGADMLQPLGRSVDVAPDALATVLTWLATGKARGFLPAARVDGLRFVATDIDVRCGAGTAVVEGPALAVCGAILGRRAFLSDLSGAGADVLAHRI